MIDSTNLKLPGVLQGITSTTEDLELTMGSELRFGSLLRTLAAGQLGGRVLQLGTGSGFLTAWLLDGMAGLPDTATLTGIEPDADLADVASRFLSRDSRFELRSGEVATELTKLEPGFSLAVASTPGVIAGQRRETLQLLAPGGLLVIGGLAEREDWSAAGRQDAQTVLDRLAVLEEWRLTVMDWAGGVALATRRQAPDS